MPPCVLGGFVHCDAQGANTAGGQLAQATGRSRSILSTKIHLACDALGYRLGLALTGANVSDFDLAKPLFKAHLHPNAWAVMDKGYCAGEIDLGAFQRRQQN